MGAPADTTLRSQIKLGLFTNYSRVDANLPGIDDGPEDNLQYLPINHDFVNGRGANRMNLQFHDKRNINNETELLDLDGVLLNQFGMTLDYDAVGILLVRNNADIGSSLYLDVSFKSERWYIGPQGSRIAIEPDAKGIVSIVSSASSEEGNITVVGNGSMAYDIIIIGSDQESSSSSG